MVTMMMMVVVVRMERHRDKVGRYVIPAERRFVSTRCCHNNYRLLPGDVLLPLSPLSVVPLSFPFSRGSGLHEVSRKLIEDHPGLAEVMNHDVASSAPLV